jgi:hypothetical protein
LANLPFLISFGILSWNYHSNRGTHEGKHEKVILLANDDPNDHAVESLRSFRTSLQFSMRDHATSSS